MRLLRFRLIAASVLLSVCALSQMAYADSQSVSNCGTNCDGYAFQATLTPLPSPPNPANTYSLSYTITNNNTTSTNDAYAYTWSLTLFQSGSSITPGSVSNFSATSGGTDYTGEYQALVGKTNGGNGGCNSSLTDAICVMPGSGVTNNQLAALGPGQSATFSFDFVCVNCTEASSWDFLGTGKCTSGSGNCYALSNNGVAMPEPSSWTLLGFELMVAASVLLLWFGLRMRNPLERDRRPFGWRAIFN